MPENKISFCLTGSGAVRVNLDRAGPSQVVHMNGRTYLFDCGRNTVHNLVRFGFAVEKIDYLFLTHLHFDHVCDVAYFILLSWNNGRRHKLHIFGPPGTKEFLHYAITMAYHQDIESRVGHGKSMDGLDWQVTEIQNDGPFWHDSSLTLSALSTRHAEMPNLNYSLDAFGRKVIITSDTTFSDALIDFCQEADLLVVECSGTRPFLSEKPWGHWHMTPETVAELAHCAQVKTVVLKHLVIENFSDDPEISEKMAAEIRSAYSGSVRVGYDGLRIEL